MASLKYLIQSKNNPSTIYLRLSLDRTTNFKKKTPLLVNPKNWSSKKGKGLQMFFIYLHLISLFINWPIHQ